MLWVEWGKRKNKNEGGEKFEKKRSVGKWVWGNGCVCGGLSRRGLYTRVGMMSPKRRNEVGSGGRQRLLAFWKAQSATCFGLLGAVGFALYDRLVYMCWCVVGMCEVDDFIFMVLEESK